MWRPPQRIKWYPTPGAWPDAREAAQSALFAPLRHRALAVENRTWVPAMVPWRATNEGFVTPANIEWYARFARGRPGAIVLEATGIRDVPSGPLLRIGDDRFIEGLSAIARAVHEASEGQTRLFIQLIDFLSIRRRPDPRKFIERFLPIGPHHREALGLPRDVDEATVRMQLASLDEAALKAVLLTREFEALRYGDRERVTDTHLRHVAELPQVLPTLFAAAARRAREAGFDGVELHYAHAYTMASFLSAHNSRSDGYGGARENRVRLPLEVYQAVRAAVGDDYVVGCRYLADECIEGGNTLEDTPFFGVSFARAGMDFVSLSRGGKFDDAKQPRIGDAAYPYTGPSGYECMPQYISDEQGPFGRNDKAASVIRDAIRAAGFETPVVVAGGVFDFRRAESLIATGTADIVALARQSLADPDWSVKVRSGHGSEVRLCEYTNYCEALDQHHEVVTCQLWDRTHLDESGIARTPDGKRRLTPPAWSGLASKA